MNQDIDLLQLMTINWSDILGVEVNSYAGFYKDEFMPWEMIDIVTDFIKVNEDDLKTCWRVHVRNKSGEVRCIGDFKDKDGAELFQKYIKQTYLSHQKSEFKTFINGFTSWHETHYEIVQAISYEMQKDIPTGLAGERHETEGAGGLYELAEELTNEFEKLYNGFNWDGQFYDEIEKFLEIKLYHPDLAHQYKPIKENE